MAITSVKTGSSFTNLIKYDNFLGPNSPYIPSSFESIATSTPTSGSTITFSSIPQTYDSLQIRALLKGSSSVSDIAIRINGVTTSSYIWHRVQGDGTTASASTSGAGETSIRLGSFGATEPGGLILDIHNYTSTTKNKTVRAFSGYDANGSGVVSLYSGLFVDTTAVTSITVINQNTSFASGTTIALYGIKG